MQSLKASLPDGEVIFHLGLGAGSHAGGIFGEARAAEERLQSSRLEVLRPEILSYCFIPGHLLHPNQPPRKRHHLQQQ